MNGIKQALAYALDAARLLRKHPSLLLIALAMGGFSAVEGALGDFALGHMRVGTDFVQLQRQARTMLAKRRSHRPGMTKPAPPMAGAMVVIAFVSPPGAPQISLRGTVTTILALAYRPGKRPTPAKLADWNPAFAYSALVLPLGMALSFAIALFVAAGYMAVIWRLVATGDVAWKAFGAKARRVFLRFLIFHGLLFTLAAGGSTIAFAFSHRGYLGGIVLAYPFAAVLFSVNLTTFIIIAQDAGLVAALKQSVTRVWRHLTTAATLILGAGCLAWLSSQPHAAFYAQARRSARGVWDPAATALPSLPASLLTNCLLSVVGVWFCVAMFLWHRELQEAEPPPPRVKRARRRTL